MARIMVFNQKGGVGKSTTVLNLAAALYRRDMPPLVVDMDAQGNLTQIHPQAMDDVDKSLFGFYQENKPLGELFVAWDNVGNLIPAHRQLVKLDSIFGKGPAVLNRFGQGLATLEKETSLSNVIIDCCPHLGVLSLSAIFAADLVIIPISSDFLSLQGAMRVDKTLSALEGVLKRRVNRRYLITRHDRRRNMSFDVQQQALGAFGGDVLKTIISENVAIAESPHHKKDIFSFSPSSSGAKNYNALLDELIAQNLIFVTNNSKKSKRKKLVN